MKPQDRPWLAVVLGGALLGAVVAVLGGVLAPRAVELPEDVVAVIDGVEVTQLEWDVMLLQAATSNDHLEGQIADLTAAGIHPEFAREYLEALNSRPREVAALAAILADRATYAEARREWGEPSDEVVASAVEQERALVERVRGGEIEGDLSSMDRLLEAFGEDAYWTEIAAAQQRRVLAIQPLAEREVRNTESWRAMQLRLARRADVTLAPSISGDASVRGALAYLEELHEIEMRQRERRD